VAQDFLDDLHVVNLPVSWRAPLCPVILLFNEAPERFSRVPGTAVNHRRGACRRRSRREMRRKSRRWRDKSEMVGTERFELSTFGSQSLDYALEVLSGQGRNIRRRNGLR